MNLTEFNEWLTRHQSAFPEVCEKLDAYGDESPDPSDVTVKTILQEWQEALSDTQPRDAREATKRMLRGEVARPKWWTEHPTCVAKIAREIAQTRAAIDKTRSAGRSRTYRCNVCFDSGWIECWSAAAVKYFKQNVIHNPPDWNADAGFVTPERFKKAREMFPRIMDGCEYEPFGWRLSQQAEWQEEVKYEGARQSITRRCSCAAGDGESKKYIERYDPLKHLPYDYTNPAALAKHLIESVQGVEFNPYATREF